MVYAIFNLLLWIILLVMNKSGLSRFMTTRRAMKGRMRWVVVVIYPFLLVQIVLMLRIYDCQATSSITIVSAHLVFLSWETLWTLKFAVIRVSNKCRSRADYYYESSDEEDDRNFFERASLNSIELAIEGRRRRI